MRTDASRHDGERERVSDAERERAVDVLKAHAVSGRLTTDELAVRTQEAHAARTGAELGRATRGLPSLPDAPLLTRLATRVPLRVHVAAYLVVGAAAIVAWAATRERDAGSVDEGFGYLWPFWILLAWGILVVAHALYALRRPAIRRARRRALGR